MVIEMTDRTDFLLVRGKPNTDESFIGYIIRLTEQNGYDSLSWILRMANLDCGKMGTSYGFVFGKPESFSLLTKLTCISLSELASITYPLADGLYFDCLFFGNIVPKSCIQLRYAKLCPVCLLESSYSRRIWDFALVTTCLKHKCLLIDECPNCGKPLTWLRNRVSVCSCEFDWRESAPLPVKESELTLTQHVHQLCGLPIYNTDTQEQINQNPVSKLSLQDLLLTIFFIAGQRQGLSVSTGRRLLAFRRNKDLHELFTTAYSAFEDWPHIYYRFLDWVREQEKNLPLNRQRQRSVLYREFGKFYLALFKILSKEQFAFVKNAFIDYLLGTWEGYCVSSLCSKKNAASRLKSRYISKIDARRLLETDDKYIKQIIRTGELKTVGLSKGKKRLIFVELTDIVKLRV